MANNRIQVKRTSTTGRTPNTTNIANTQYIAAGELALNMTDGILYSSDGSSLIEIGANNINVRITNTLTVNSVSANGTLGTDGQVLTSNGTTVYWSSISSGSVNTAAQYVWTNTHTFSNTIILNAISANGSLGTSGQVLTSNGSDTYWATSSGTASFDYGLSYAFKTQPF